MKLNTKLRSVEKKREVKRLRREGLTPAVVYGQKVEAEHIIVNNAEFQAALREIPKGRLATAVFTLAGEDGKERKAVVKDIQYEPTTYQIIHMDFELLQEGIQIKLNVPIEFTGVVECAGVKQGGVLRQVVRSLRVSCLPKDIPAYFEIDVRSLGMKQHKKLSAIKMPEAVRPIKSLDQAAVVIAKR